MKTSFAMMAFALLTAGAAQAGDSRTEVTAQLRAWEAAANSHDVARVMALYADDAQYIYGFQGQEGAGRASLEAFWKQSFQMTPDIAVTLKSVEVVPVNANVAVGMALWEDTFTGPDGKKVTAQVQTSEVFVKEKGAWKIRVDHASFVPPPQPPPPAAK